MVKKHENSAHQCWIGDVDNPRGVHEREVVLRRRVASWRRLVEEGESSSDVLLDAVLAALQITGQV